MPRKANMPLDEMVDYLLKDLKKSVTNDVQPCLQFDFKDGGYFVVPRLVLSYVDYLGALYNGYQGKVNKRTGRRIFSEATYAKNFLRCVFGLIDKNYVQYGDHLWEMYRNGTIHLYEPLTLENGGKTLSWQIFKTALADRTILLPIGPNRSYLPATHLVPILVDINVWVQPISTGCLYNDLMQAIDKYAGLLRNNLTLQTSFSSIMNQLVVPDSTILTWP